jgi:hypothetical protein
MRYLNKDKFKEKNLFIYENRPLVKISKEENIEYQYSRNPPLFEMIEFLDINSIWVKI